MTAKSPASTAEKGQGAASRFGDSQFAASRFGQGQAGVWVDAGPPDPQGRVAGQYRPGSGDGRVTGLTVLRPDSAQRTLPVVAPTARQPPAPRPLNLPGGRRGVLLFHGLSSTPLELQYLGRGLHKAGYSVRIAVIPGYTHGLRTAGTGGHRQWAQAAVDEFDRMREQCDSLAVGGLCIGALLSLHVAASRPGLVSHVLSLSTTLHYDGWGAPRTRWLLPLARLIPKLGHIGVREREPYGLKDERLRAWVAAQMKESGGSDAGAASLRVRDLLEAQDLMRVVRAGLRRIDAPTLLLHAKDDEVASPRSALEVADGVGSGRVHCVMLNDSYHMISIDQEKAKVLGEMRDFLQDATPAADAGVIGAPSAAPSIHRSTQHVRA